MESLKKNIVIVAGILILGGAVGFSLPVDKDIKIADVRGGETVKVYLKRVTLNGEIPHFIIGRVSRDDILQAYLELFEESGSDKTYNNLWEGIREGEREKGTTVRDVQLVRKR